MYLKKSVKKGFSIVSVLIVLLVMAIFLSISSPRIQSIYNYKVISGNLNSVLSGLKIARVKSKNGNTEFIYGVKDNLVIWVIKDDNNNILLSDGSGKYQDNEFNNRIVFNTQSIENNETIEIISYGYNYKISVGKYSDTYCISEGEIKCEI